MMIANEVLYVVGAMKQNAISVVVQEIAHFKGKMPRLHTRAKGKGKTSKCIVPVSYFISLKITQTLNT
jgi:hypothetical protein